ncbi:hypothetical protein JTE90_019041 [Oedothorax gibbosus]|uniref:Uncharacterized protein n=1 Tax=Oedothorax gibbosus TaxID=931172 RepID=A0AAV6V0B6_9ARAC|nr:hypothetical protein JTE90_019041 [Oedothorax gibbosus]
MFVCINPSMHIHGTFDLSPFPPWKSRQTVSEMRLLKAGKLQDDEVFMSLMVHPKITSTKHHTNPILPIPPSNLHPLFVHSVPVSRGDSSAAKASAVFALSQIVGCRVSAGSPLPRSWEE